MQKKADAKQQQYYRTEKQKRARNVPGLVHVAYKVRSTNTDRWAEKEADGRYEVEVY